MIYKRFIISVIAQLCLILVVLTGIAFLFFQMERQQYIYTFIVLFNILIFQVFFMIRYITLTNRELAKFIEAIGHEDFSLKYPDSKSKNSIAELRQSFNTIIETFRKVKIDREVQFNFLQLIIESVEIGIIAIDAEQQLVLMNTAAENILGVRKCSNWRQLKNKTESFCRQVEEIFGGGKKLLEKRSDNELLNISVELINTTLLGTPHKLITIIDIKEEIEKKELDSWIKLIRVLNHEIMNSTTPISSLTETILMLLEDKENGQKDISELNDQLISDIIYSAKTIQKRSDGLYDFVNEYRKLTKVPRPKIKAVNIIKLMKNLKKLMQAELVKNNIDFDVRIDSDELEFSVDSNLVEQVLINLIRNSMEALENVQNPVIIISAGTRFETKYISVIDNGHGIAPEIIDEIFVPFFSTKDEGSGIGLSLSRQIMRLHNGQISIKSNPYEKTEVVLSFS